MDDCKPTPSPFQSGVKLSATCTSPEVNATLYCQLVGILLYLTHTRPDLSFVVGLVARYMKTHHESHWKVAKRILRYVRGTIQFGIHYSSGGTPLLVGFTDSDWAGDPDDRKSTVGYVFSLGSGPITWAYKKQQAISLSSAEAEYRAAVNASQEALWLRQILSEFGFQHQHPTRLSCDNQSAICWDSEMSYFHPPFPSLFLTFHRPIKPLSYPFHKYIWVSHHYFPLYSF
jgi:hypothetical protein